MSRVLISNPTPSHFSYLLVNGLISVTIVKYIILNAIEIQTNMNLCSKSREVSNDIHIGLFVKYLKPRRTTLLISETITFLYGIAEYACMFELTTVRFNRHRTFSQNDL